MDVTALGQLLLQDLPGHVHGDHGAGIQTQTRGLVHALGPLVDDAEAVLPGKDPGHAQGQDFPHAVSGHGRRLNPQGEQLAHHGILQGEQGRLLPAGLLQVLVLGVEHQVQEIEVGPGGDPLHPLADQGKGLVKVPAHPRIIGALTRKDQGQGRRCVSLGSGEDSLPGEAPQGFIRQRGGEGRQGPPLSPGPRYRLRPPPPVDGAGPKSGSSGTTPPQAAPTAPAPPVLPARPGSAADPGPAPPRCR